MEKSRLERARIDVVLSFESWRRRLLTPKALAKLASDLGLGWFSEADITGLWKLGILRADLVVSDIPLDLLELHSLQGFEEMYEYAYCDFRRIEHRLEGYGSALQGHESSILDGSLAFHPFRVYVLHHVERTLKIGTSSMQFLMSEQGILRVAQRLQDGSRQWTSSVGFCERFHYWNEIAEMAAVVEPSSYKIVLREKESLPIVASLTGDLDSALREMLIEIGKGALFQMRSDLAFAAETLDCNRSIHVLLRLMNRHERERLKGKLGGAMHFLAMAESLRRCAERAFVEDWPEEDEIGPGEWFPGARKRLYGHERVFDAPRHNLRDYLTQLGLDFSVKVRCYVEGDTEYGALEHAAGTFGHVQLVNLSGSVAEKRGKGLAFVESLDADKKSGIFSVVILDGDREEYVRLLRKAAEVGRFHGCFFICTPDIECGNFSARELIETGLRDLEKNEKDYPALMSIKPVLLSQVDKIKSNTDLLELFKQHGLTHLRKSHSWGKALMELAIVAPFFPDDHVQAGQKRPIVEAAELLGRTQDVGFFRSLAVERVDPQTGRIVSRFGQVGL